MLYFIIINILDKVESSEIKKVMLTMCCPCTASSIASEMRLSIPEPPPWNFKSSTLNIDDFPFVSSKLPTLHACMCASQNAKVRFMMTRLMIKP